MRKALGHMTLYAITDNRTGSVIVRPGPSFPGVGEAVTIRQATRSEAERLWQKPLHPGWNVKEDE